MAANREGIHLHAGQTSQLICSSSQDVEVAQTCNRFVDSINPNVTFRTLKTETCFNPS